MPNYKSKNIEKYLVDLHEGIAQIGIILRSG